MIDNETVMSALSDVQRRNGVRVIAAVSLDDATKGYPSKRQTKAIRYVYARPTNDYLSVYERKVTMHHTEQDMSLDGYDLKEFLPMLKRSDLDACEFMASKDVYAEHPAFRPVRAFANACFDRRAMAISLTATVNDLTASEDADAYDLLEAAHQTMMAKACMAKRRMPPIRLEELAREADCTMMLPSLKKLAEIAGNDADEELTLVKLNVRKWVKTERNAIREQLRDMGRQGETPYVSADLETMDDIFRDIVTTVERTEPTVRPKPPHNEPRPNMVLAYPNERKFSAREVVRTAHREVARRYDGKAPTTCAWPEMRLSPAERTDYVMHLMESVRDTDATLLVVTQDVLVMRAVEIACARIECADRLDIMLIEDTEEGSVTDDISSEELYRPYSDAMQRLEDMQYAIYDD